MIESIALNGFTFSATGASIQAVSGNGMPTIRSSTENLSQQDGSISTGYRYGARIIGWSGDLVASSLTLYMTLRQSLMLALRPGSLQGDDMVFTLSDGSTRTLRDVVCIDQNLDLPSGEASRTWNSYQVTFRAHFPFFEGAAHDNTQDRTIISGGVGIPAVIPMSFASGTSSSSDPLVVDNAGNAQAYPIFTISGSGTLFTITNSTNGQQMVINTTLSSGSQIIIDIRRQTVTMNGSSIMQYVSGEWITLDAGENTLSLSVDSGYTSDTSMRTEFYDTYMGI